MAHNFNLTLVEALNRASLFLSDHHYPAQDAQMYWLYYKDWTLTELVQALHQPVDAEDWATFEGVLERIVQDEPIQYILGYADFLDGRFKVTPDTLIPREDTAGIISLASPFLKAHPQASVLDIGTGTGILAITLATRFPEADITATDISSSALAVARDNVEDHSCAVELIESDLFEGLSADDSFDLIVSNPPYVSHQELAVMDASVKKFEPQQALFAEDNGLAIYRRLAQDGPTYLKSKGMMILEIGYKQGPDVQAMMKQAFPGKEVTIVQDMNGLDRYIHIYEGEMR